MFSSSDAAVYLNCSEFLRQNQRVPNKNVFSWGAISLDSGSLAIIQRASFYLRTAKEVQPYDKLSNWISSLK